MPEVSVIIPAYNAAGTLGETLASLLAQTLADFEVIVVDDGSTDATAEVAAGTGDGRVRVLTVPNGGVARARNRGIADARAELITFLDADDLWRPTKLERQVTALAENPDAGMCVTGAVRIDEASREIEPMPLTRTAAVAELLLLESMASGCISSGMVRRTTLDAAGHFNPRFSQCADWDLWLRLSCVTTFVQLDEDLVLYRVHANNMSKNVALLESDTFAVLDDFFADPRSAPYRHLRNRVYSVHWLICSGSHLHAGHLAGALRCLLRGLAADPTNLGRLLTMPQRWLRRLAPALRVRT